MTTAKHQKINQASSFNYSNESHAKKVIGVAYLIYNTPESNIKETSKWFIIYNVFKSEEKL